MINWIKDNWGIVLLVICIAASLRLAYLVGKSKQTFLYRDNTAQIDSLDTKIDTVYIDRVETITKYKTRIINETIYINNSTDSVQVDVRSNVRHNAASYLQSR